MILNLFIYFLTLNEGDVVTIVNTAKSGSPNLLEKNMPWIAAIVVGLLTVLTNILVSYQLRKTNRKIIIR